MVTTFDPGGGYGHPDNMAMSRHTLNACLQSGDAKSHPELGEPWSPERLFYTVFPRGRLEELMDLLVSLGEDGSRYERRIDRAWPDSDVHVVVDVSATVDAKWNAVRRHRTQQGTFTMMSRTPEDVAERIHGPRKLRSGASGAVRRPDADGPLSRAVAARNGKPAQANFSLCRSHA